MRTYIKTYLSLLKIISELLVLLYSRHKNPSIGGIYTHIISLNTVQFSFDVNPSQLYLIILKCTLQFTPHHTRVHYIHISSSIFGPCSCVQAFQLDFVPSLQLTVCDLYYIIHIVGTNFEINCWSK